MTARLRLPADAMNGLAAQLPPGVSGRLLTDADAALLAELRREVVSRQLPDPNCYRVEAESPDFPPSHLGPHGPGEKGVIAGLFSDGGELIAYAALTLPRPGEVNHGDALGLPPDQRDQVAYLASAMVRADWRGRGLHHGLVIWRLQLAAALGRRHAIAATWPGNYQSWGHFCAHGMLGERLILVGEGLLRLAAHRDLAAPAPVIDPATRRLVIVSALADQGALFDAGYRLWRRVRRDDGVFAELARPLPVAGG